MRLSGAAVGVTRNGFRLLGRGAGLGGNKKRLSIAMAQPFESFGGSGGVRTHDQGIMSFRTLFN